MEKPKFIVMKFYSRLSVIIVIAFSNWINPLQAMGAGVPVVTSLSTDFISVVQTEPYTTTVAMYGENLDYLLFNPVIVQLGSLQASSISGNANGVNLVFPVSTILITLDLAQYPLIVKNNTETNHDIILTTAQLVTIFNPYVQTYKNPHIKYGLNHLKPKLNHRTVGLNTHWALAGDVTIDSLYEQRLVGSNTTWVREHFNLAELNGYNWQGWLTRYDKIMLEYQAKNIQVVGMLAYGDTEHWPELVRTVVTRYRNYVDVWELWNEPDSATYLQPNTWKTYKPLLKSGSQVIRETDPYAIILNGAVSDITNRVYLKKLFKHGNKWFDELNVHVYYCGYYQADGEKFTQLKTDWDSLEKLMKKYKPAGKIWVTELGCSTGQGGVDDALVRRYLPQAAQVLLNYKNVRPILLYTFRDRPYLGAYEANFGLVHEDGSPKTSWEWYRQLPE
ncbi:MAG: glycosyl hydrolase [Patescibacteria group bacterium]